MAKKGHRRPKPEAVKKAAGTARRDRVVVPLFPNQPGAAYAEPLRPPGMTAGARKIWDRKVDRYAARGQVVAGCEDALKQYCELEAAIDSLRRRKVEVPVGMINAFRIFAGEFYDTPASQHQTLRPPTAANPFARNGRGSAD